MTSGIVLLCTFCAGPWVAFKPCSRRLLACPICLTSQHVPALPHMHYSKAHSLYQHMLATCADSRNHMQLSGVHLNYGSRISKQDERISRALLRHDWQQILAVRILHHARCLHAGCFSCPVTGSSSWQTQSSTRARFSVGYLLEALSCYL